MKALQFCATGDLAALRLADLALPVVGADEVLVQVKAAGLNPSDVKNVLGRFPRSEEHTSELQSQLTISYAVFCLKKLKLK